MSSSNNIEFLTIESFKSIFNVDCIMVYIDTNTNEVLFFLYKNNPSEGSYSYYPIKTVVIDDNKVQSIVSSEKYVENLRECAHFKGVQIDFTKKLFFVVVNNDYLNGYFTTR